MATRGHRGHKALALVLAASALLWASAVPAAAATLTALTTSNSLQTFDSSAPGTLASPVGITGLEVGETVTAIDFRPTDGRLYGIAMTNGGQARLYRIDASTGAASPVGAAFSSPFGAGDTIFGIDIDFDPSADRLRFVTIWNDHRRIDPDSGAVTTLPTLAYVATDVNAGNTPFVAALAYSPNFPGATSLTAFGYEGFNDDAIRLGSPGGSPSGADTGELFTYNTSAGVTTFGQRYGFDVAPDGAAFLSTRSGAGADERTRLFSYNLTVGTFSEVGLIGDGADVIADVVTQPVSNAIRFSSAAASGTEGDRVTVGLTRSNTIGAASVEVGAGPGSSAGPTDYSGLPGAVTFADGSATAAFEVQLLDDSVNEGDETLALALSNPRGGRATLADPAASGLTIHNRGGGSGGGGGGGGGGSGSGSGARRCAGKRATIVGTGRRDVVRGTRRADVIVTLAGNDSVKGGRGNDLVCAGAGSDRAAGGPGGDVLRGMAGRDVLRGEAGKDVLRGGGGRDRLLGGRGADLLLGGGDRDVLRGGPGRDRQRQ